MRSNLKQQPVVSEDLQRQIAIRIKSDESRIFDVFASLGIRHKVIAKTLEKSEATITQWSKGNTRIQPEDFAALVSLARFCLTAARGEIESLAKANNQKVKLLSDDVATAETMLSKLEAAS